MDKLREKQRQLEVAQVENQLLKMKVKSWNVDFLLTLLFFPSFLSPPMFNSSISFFSVLLLVRFPNHLWPAPQGWLEGAEEVSVSDCQSRRGSCVNTPWDMLPLGPRGLKGCCDGCHGMLYTLKRAFGMLRGPGLQKLHHLGFLQGLKGPVWFDNEELKGTQEENPSCPPGHVYSSARLLMAWRCSCPW